MDAKSDSDSGQARDPDPTRLYEEAEARIQKSYVSLVAGGKWLDCPMVVSIETYAKCNAACDFCPYPDMLRQGARLDQGRVMDLIEEVGRFARHPARLNFSRVNEPFLDPRLFDFLEQAARVLPNTALVLFSNGQTITDRVIDRLNTIPTFRSLSLSFNEHDPVRYQQVMGLDQSKTLARLRRLHERVQAGSVNFSVSLSRVGTSDADDRAFLDWCAQEFPAFPVGSSARFDWIGTDTAGVSGAAPDAGCAQWFSLHILADGQSAFCCIDGEGAADGMDSAQFSLSEIYNAPAKRRLREQIVSRRAVPGCATCPHGMPSLAYEAVDT